MISRFPDGNHPLRNRQAGLLHAGGHSPLGERRTGGISAFTGSPRIAAHTGRPGPRPMTARQATAIHAQNARVKREVDQTMAACQQAIRESNSQAVQRAQRLTFSSYDFDKRPDGVELTDRGGSPLGLRRVQVGSLWVFVTSLHDGWGDHRYYIYNPQTGAVLEFTPEASLGASQQLYASKGAQFRGIAAATGRAGEHMQVLFGGTAAIFLTGGLALEYGGYAWATEQAVPFVSRVAVRGWQLARPGLQAYGKRIGEGMVARVGIDLGIQLTSGFAMGQGSVLDRGTQAAKGINGTSLVISALINTEGVTLSKLGKWLVAGSTAAAGNLVTVSGENKGRYGSYLHGVDFSDGQQSAGFAFNVLLGALLDRGREQLVDRWGEGLAKRAAQASRPATQAALRWVNVTRVSLGLNLSMGTSFESSKKWLEQRWEGYNKSVEDEGEKELARTRQPTQPGPATPK